MKRYVHVTYCGQELLLEGEFIPRTATTQDWFDVDGIHLGELDLTEFIIALSPHALVDLSFLAVEAIRKEQL